MAFKSNLVEVHSADIGDDPTKTFSPSGIAFADKPVVALLTFDDFKREYTVLGDALNAHVKYGGVLQIVIHAKDGRAYEFTLDGVEERPSNPLAGLFGSILANSLAQPAETFGNPSSNTKERYVNALFQVLKDTDTVVVRPANDRSAENTFEVSGKFFTRMQDMKLLGACPVCSWDAKRLVAHPENDEDMAKVKEFLAIDLANA